MTVSYRIYGDVAELSPNKRFHWRTRHRLEQEWQTKARLAWMETTPRLFLPGRVRVSFAIYRGRFLDACNLHGSRALKGIIDGLKGQLFADDSPRYLDWGEVTQHADKAHRDNPHVVLVVETVTERDQTGVQGEEALLASTEPSGS